MGYIGGPGEYPDVQAVVLATGLIEVVGFQWLVRVVHAVHAVQSFPKQFSAKICCEVFN